MDALEDSRTGTTKSWFRFNSACVRFNEKKKMAAAIDHFNCALEFALEKLGKLYIYIYIYVSNQEAGMAQW